MGGLSSQLANECCCEKTAVYNVKSGTWTSPFQASGEYLNVSDLWSKSSSAAPKGDIPAVVLVGGTGVGKSNLGNYLLGHSAFESRNSQESVTRVTTWIDGSWFGGKHPVRVVDCTGIGDTKGASADQKQWDTTIDVLKKVGKIHALVMVMRAGRFTKFDKEVISVLRESFGPAFWKNMCVFCTGASAKPAQLDLEVEGPKIRRKLHQIEKEQGGDDAALQAIQRMHVYAADLDPALACYESRQVEFKFKPVLSGMSLEELLSLDLKIPPNVMEMSTEEFRRFASSDSAIERWIEGNYFQLGLARLAAFKTDVSSMEPFSPGNLARLADAPKDEPPPPEMLGEGLAAQEGMRGGISAVTVGAEESRKYFTELDSLELAVVGEDVALVRGSFFEHLAQTGGTLPRRQDMPKEAFWDPMRLIQGLQQSGNQPMPLLVSVSYCWLTRWHPDPEGFVLHSLVPLLQAYAHWHRTTTDSIAVFLDWCSLPQAPRSTNENIVWSRAMQNIHLWYAHASLSVWMLTRVPNGIVPYGQRGWPFFERSLSGILVTDSALDLGMLRPQWNTWAHVLQDCKVKPQPPLPPDAFAAELLRRTLSEDSDRELLARRYGEAFRCAIGLADVLQFGGLHWSDREAARVARLLPLCECLRELELQQNDFTGKGARALLQSVVQCPQLERVALWGNCIEPDVQQALVQGWMQTGRPAAALEVGDQRRPAPQAEAMATQASMSGNMTPSSTKMMAGLSSKKGPPISPSGARRSPEDMAALQMAELGARQAAFEARLHVAINRISSTLTEVGDAVSTPASGMPSTVSPMAGSQTSPARMFSPVASGVGGDRMAGYD